MKIAVVILNWNGKKLLEKFLPSVVENSPEATIYLADNASTDDSIAFVKVNYPNIHLIKNEKNYGFAKGYNKALKNINADIYCLLNSDIEVTKNWLPPIIERFKNSKETSIIQPKILDYNKRTHFEYAGAAGGFVDKYGYAYCKGRIFNSIEEDKHQYQSGKIFWASGAAFCIRSQVFWELDGFDEDYFAHYEEIDLCWRAFNKSYTTESVLTSTVYHLGGGTLKNSSPFKTYLNFRNSLFTLLKNLPKQQLFPIIFIRLVLDGIASVRFLFRGEFIHIISILKAHLNFYMNLRRMYQKRNYKHLYNYFSKQCILKYFLTKKTNHYEK